MKIGSNFNRLWVLLLAGVLQAACTAGPDEPVSLSDRGEPVEVSFVMYKGSVVEEAVCRDTGGVTRAAVAGAVDMAAGKMFRVYVYEVQHRLDEPYSDGSIYSPGGWYGHRHDAALPG